MKKFYFTFGQDHIHEIDGFIFDKDVVVEIENDDPRDTMFKIFGRKWAMQYYEKPNMDYFPRGIKAIK